MVDDQEVRARLYERLRELIVVERDFNVSDEIYYDLKLSGSDLFELLIWVGREFDVNFSAMNIGDYAPHEGPEIVRPILELCGRRPYRSLRIGDLLRVIESKAWPPGGA
jgi:hypothetical protein